MNKASICNGKLGSVTPIKLAHRASLRKLSALLAITLVGGMAVIVDGCGGGAGSGSSGSSNVSKAATGRAIVTVLWPALPGGKSAATRLIPEATNLIHLDVMRTVNGVSTVVGSGQAIRAGSSVNTIIEIDNLPVDTLTVIAKAYPGTDPNNLGTAVAQGSIPVTTQDGQTTSFSLTMSSTIDHIDLAPIGGGVAPGVQTPMTATAWNGPNEATAAMVLLSPDQLQWTTSDSTLANVNSAGVVTGVSPGTPTITVTDAESTKTASTPVAVPVVIAISPAAPSLSVTDSLSLVATVAGVSNPAVTWSVTEGAGAGTVSSAGVYTAPSTRGTYHVTATYVSADTTQTATATAALTVQSGIAIGTVQ